MSDLGFVVARSMVEVRGSDIQHSAQLSLVNKLFFDVEFVKS